ncbi:GPI anchored serine-threonine rich family protein [Streptomyces sp. 4.24]|uniref:GPI anchored serine-threonine rich family protein n=1 Tax=Streptomyces tritrimontium TaxID=3406573 RepID=UPI003BB6CF8C
MKDVLRRVNRALSHPNAAVLLDADSVLVVTPGPDTVWAPGDRVRIGWRLVGLTGHPMDIALVRVDGSRVSEDLAVLAIEVEPTDLGLTVTVPENLAPAGNYAIAVTSHDPMAVYSPAFRITAG